MRMQWKSKKDTLYNRFYRQNGDFSMKRENFDRVPKGEGISPDHRNQSSVNLLAILSQSQPGTREGGSTLKKVHQKG